MSAGPPPQGTTYWEGWDDLDGSDSVELTARAESSRPDLRPALLFRAITLTHSRESDYAHAARMLARALEQQGRPRAALSASWYCSPRSEQEPLLGSVPAVDRARTLALWAERKEAPAKESHRRAARLLEGSDLLVRAAVHYERAGALEPARALWARLAGMLDGEPDRTYEAGLARFNVARVSSDMGDESTVRASTVAAVHRLEEAADRFEAGGARERAFDCYHVLIAIGRRTETFEHVLEGCVNAIRILREDHLGRHALRLYEHALDLAERAAEHAAAATLARDMASHAREQALPGLATRCLLRQADLWTKVADALLEHDSPVELAESALLASAVALAEAEQYEEVARRYRRLAGLGVDSARVDRYRKAAERCAGAGNRRVDGSSVREQLGPHVEPPDVWHDDLLEWEEKGSAAEACADVVLDPAEQLDSITRRAALVGRLVALEVEPSANDPRLPKDRRAGLLVTLAGRLASVERYSLIASLEHLYRHDRPAVRRAAVEALGRYLYKRTFATLEIAVRDADAGVVAAARRAMERLRFDHAFDPLARIYRTSTGETRAAALAALAHIDLDDAASLLLSALEHGGPDERKAAIRALRNGRGGRFVEMARAAYPEAPPTLRAAIEDVLASRGVSLGTLRGSP